MDKNVQTSIEPDNLVDTIKKILSNAGETLSIDPTSPDSSSGLRESGDSIISNPLHPFRLEIANWTNESISFKLLDLYTFSSVIQTVPFKKEVISPSDILVIFSEIPEDKRTFVPLSLLHDTTVSFFFVDKDIHFVYFMLKKFWPDVDTYVISFSPQNRLAKKESQRKNIADNEVNQVPDKIDEGLVVFPPDIVVTKKRGEEQQTKDILTLAGTKIPKATVATEDIQKIRESLDKKYPWLKELTESVLVPIEVSSLLKQEKNGRVPIGFNPVLVVGPPGIGKTAWAADFGRCAGIPNLLIALGGKNTSLGFRSCESEYQLAEPSPILMTIARSVIANPLVVLDEIDKVADSRQNGNVQDTALHYFDPMTNKAIYDDYLKVPVDLSGVLWICTANDKGAIADPLLDRLNVIEVDYPTTDHVQAILETIMKEFCGRFCSGDLEALSNLPNIDGRLSDIVFRGIREKKSLRQIGNETDRAIYETVLGRRLAPRASDKRDKKIGFEI